MQSMLKMFFCIAILAFPVTSVYAQDTQPKEESVIVSDLAFDGVVDIDLAGQALCVGDASLLTDVALQLAAAERILLRSHESGITADSLLVASVNLATETKDKDALARLAKGAQSLGKQYLADKVSAAQKICESSSDVPELTVSVKEMSTEDYAALHEILSRILLTKVTSDATWLENWEVRCGFQPGSKHHAHLKSLITKTLADLPKSESGANLLTKLAEESRAIIIEPQDESDEFSLDGPNDHRRPNDNQRPGNWQDGNRPNDNQRPGNWDGNRPNDNQRPGHWQDGNRPGRHVRQCRSCHGRGSTFTTCSSCHGRGWSRHHGRTRPCLRCARTGKVSYICRPCRGSGWVR